MSSEDNFGNKIRNGLYINDDRESVIEHHEEGSTTSNRYYGGEWHEHRANEDDRDEADE